MLAQALGNVRQPRGSPLYHRNLDFVLFLSPYILGNGVYKIIFYLSNCLR